MSASRIIPFKISTMDSLGQGVSKESERVTFIAKTAPGDEGEAEITAEKKGVAFARIKTLTRASELRTQPDCIHFESCPSCHYLHVPYEQEVIFKKQAFENLFRKSPLPSIEVVPALRRLGYRNRVQLHYDLSKKSLGMLDARKQTIVPIPNCQIALPPIQAEIQRLYANSRWLQEAPRGPARGHVELYLKQEKLQVSWNRPYADGGFTQVFAEMNAKLKQELDEWLGSKKLTDLLDLFGGDGNLSKGLNYSNRLCVDQYRKAEGDYFSQDLYATDALARVQKTVAQRGLQPNVLLLDPPRAGFKELKLWLSAFRPAYLAYVSCDPHTLARDIYGLEDYQMVKAYMVDFFPSTFHFESMLLFERKS